MHEVIRWALLAAGVISLPAAGYVAGSWGRRRAGRWQYEQGFNAGEINRNEATERRMRDGWRLVMHPVTEQPVWAGFYTGAQRPKEPGIDDRPDDRDMMRLPGRHAAPVSHLPSQAQYRAELAAIGTGRPASMLQPVTFDDEPERGPVSDPEPPAAQPWATIGAMLGSLGLAQLYADSQPVIMTLPRGYKPAGRSCCTHPGTGLCMCDCHDDDASVSYAGEPAELELEAGAADLLEAEIDAYLANKANGDVWRLEQEIAHREFCNDNGLRWQPIEWGDD